MTMSAYPPKHQPSSSSYQICPNPIMSLVCEQEITPRAHGQDVSRLKISSSFDRLLSLRSPMCWQCTDERHIYACNRKRGGAAGPYTTSCGPPLLTRAPCGTRRVPQPFFVTARHVQSENVGVSSSNKADRYLCSKAQCDLSLAGVRASRTSDEGAQRTENVVNVGGGLACHPCENPILV